MDWWLLKSGSRTDISQGAKPDRSRPSAERTDGDPRPHNTVGTNMTDGEQGARGRTKQGAGVDMAEEAERTTTSENQDTGNGARLNSLVRWLRGKKRPAEIPLGELKTSSEEANEGNDGGSKRLKSHEATRTVEKKTRDGDDEWHPSAMGSGGGDKITEGVG